MNEWIYYAIAVSLVFVIQSILSLIGTDLDTDTDMDVTPSDVISFKGLTHFLIGFTWSMVVYDNYIVSLIAGIFMVFIMYYLYKFMNGLSEDRKLDSDKDMIGRTCEIISSSDDYTEVQVSINGSLANKQAISKSNKIYKIGEVTEVISYEVGKIIIK